MIVEAIFSNGLREHLDGKAIGDEFDIQAHARIISAEEALIEITTIGDEDPQFTNGDLIVRIMLSNVEAA